MEKQEEQQPNVEVGEMCEACGTYYYDLWCPNCKMISKKPQK